LLPGDVVNAADRRAGGVAPGEIVDLFPSGAGPSRMVPWGLQGNMNAATSLGETRVLFDGVAVPIIYAKSGHVSTFVPYEVEGKTATEVVVEYQGRRSSAATLAVVSQAPAVFTLDGSGRGQAAMLNDTGCCNSVRNPAVRGSLASLYATGEGRLEGGKIPRGVAVTVGGVPARIYWVGKVGNLQVNFRVPGNAPIGDAVPLVLTVGDRRSSPDVTMAVRSARQRIIVVEADPALRNLMTRGLRAAGYDVFAARNSQRAEALAEKKPDLVILDLKMPQAEKFGMVQALRNTQPQLRLMAVLATAGPKALQEADMLGAQAVLPRPINDQQMISRVRALLRRRLAVY
jgi:uncharacterized protein (TIGR03437 family)